MPGDPLILFRALPAGLWLVAALLSGLLTLDSFARAFAGLGQMIADLIVIVLVAVAVAVVLGLFALVVLVVVLAADNRRRYG